MDNIIKSEYSSSKTEFMKTETTQFKIEKSESEETKATVTTDTLNNNIKSENDSGKIVRNKVLKRKFTEDGVAIERVLSEGETSSGFETVSSANSSDVGDLDDLELSSLYDCDDESDNNFNVIVHIENELAYRNMNESEKRHPYRNDYCSRNHKKDVHVNSHTTRRHDKDRSLRWKSNENKYYKPSKRHKWSSEREITTNSRKRTFCEVERNTQDWNRKSRWSDNRFRHSKSNEQSFRCRDSRSPERKVRCRTSSIKDRKAESRHSGSFDKYSSNARRSSPVKKRRRSSRSPCSVWSRLDGHMTPPRVKKEKLSTDKRNLAGEASRKRRRTPFLVELDRKLKEAERSKKQANADDTIPMPQLPIVTHQTPNPAHPLNLPTIPMVQGMYRLNYQQMPTMSVDNLPLVRGPTGLPIHITITGEKIPYDMDGKRIPIGPNGFYLPVDPTGRLFPHIVSPANQAIPIHMTDDGVLRLPDSEPIPFGSCHQLPINTDGRVIFVGPDSKPLFPYPNLPREPPTSLKVKFGGESPGTQQTMPKMENQQVDHKQAQPRRTSDQLNLQASKIDLDVSVTTKNPPEENNNDATLVKHKKMDEEKKKSTEKEKDLRVSRFRLGVERPCHTALLQNKTSKGGIRSGSEIILDSRDSVSEGKSESESDRGSNEGGKIIPEEQGFLEIVCGNKSFAIQTNYLSSDDPIVKKTEQAIKSLCEKNYKPPVFGRFIISDFSSCLVPKKFPNESPLFRNRIRLPFVTPGAKELYCLERPASVKHAKVTYKFLPQKTEKGERPPGYRYNRFCRTSATKLPVFTFDFAMQCDFTSSVIKNLSSKVIELEAEVIRLRKVNANLHEEYRNSQARNEKKSDELRKALSELQALKCSRN